MKICGWCEKLMKKQNFKRHQTSCIYKVTIGITKTEIERIKTNQPMKQVDKDVTKIEIDNVELKIFLEEIYKKSNTLHQKNNRGKCQNPN